MNSISCISHRRLPLRGPGGHASTWAVLIVLELVLTVLSMPEGRAASGLTLNSPTIAPGTPGELAIQIQSDAAPVALQLDLLHEPSRLTAGFASPGNATADHRVETSVVAPGVTRVLVYSLRNRGLGNGILATLPLRAAPGTLPGVSPVTLANVILAGSSGTALSPVTVANGVVTLRETGGPTLDVPSLSTGQVILRLRGQDGRQYTLQKSFDLVTWQDLASGTPSGGVLTHADTRAAGVTAAYYRAWESP